MGLLRNATLAVQQLTVQPLVPQSSERGVSIRPRHGPNNTGTAAAERVGNCAAAEGPLV
jgi:hypothetical protein